MVAALCKKYNLCLIEDCCYALGVTYKRQFVGTSGDIVMPSFDPAHHITMGEGEAAITNNGTFKLISEFFRDWGRDCFCAPDKNNARRKLFCWTKKLGGDLPDGYQYKYTYTHFEL